MYHKIILVYAIGTSLFKQPSSYWIVIAILFALAWIIKYPNRYKKSIVLGWYVDEEKIKKEMDEIAEVINNGVPIYELKYAVKVKNKMLRVKIDEE